MFQPDREAEEQFVAVPLCGLQCQRGCFGQMLDARSVGDRCRCSTAQNFRAQREMQLVDQIRSEQSIVQFAAALAQQSVYFPL